MRKVAFVAGFAIGYVLGTKAGRERYEQIVRATKRVRENPTVQSTAGLVQAQVGRITEKGKDALSHTRLGAAVLGESEQYKASRYETPDHLPQGF
ncbi:hypothetical protein AB0I28_30025 [Phytomonospora sp. NPDC050363]|uniref:hypothetical protein n=1 Tax=Phytomonospora sp. NPDC050363 TaxID=3155642 RepID=UPI0033C1B866